MNDFNSQADQPLIIKEDYVIERKHLGSVHVESGTLFINGSLLGSLKIYHGATVIISGKGNHSGSVHVEDGALLQVSGMQSGSTHVKHGGEVLVGLYGKLSGTLHNEGEVVVRGTFGGKQLGEGKFILDGGSIKQPQIKDGVATYIWD